MSSLRTQTLWSMMPILVTSVVSVVSVPLYFRVLGDQMYAMWFYVGTLTGAFGFMDLGLGVTVGRFMGVAMGANDDRAVRGYWSTGHAIVLPFVLFFALVFILVGTVWGPEWFNVSGANAGTLRWAMFWGGFGLFFSYYGQMWFVLAASKLDFRFLSLIRTGFSLASTLGMIGVALLFQNASALTAYSAILGAFQLLVLWHRGNTKYALPVAFRHFDKSRLLEMLPYSLKTFANLVASSVLGSADRVLLGRVAPASDFAAYNVSLNFGSRIQNLSQAAMGPIFCNTTRGVGGDRSRSPKSIYRDSFELLFPWYGLVVVWLAVWHQPLLQMWLADKSTLVASAFPWVVAGCCISALSNISGSQLGPLNRVGTGLIFSLVSSGLSALFVVLGWHLAGLNGASIGFLLARLPMIVQDTMVRRLVGLFYDRRDLRLLMRLMVFFLISAGVHFVINLFEPGLLGLVVGAFCSGLLCAAFNFWKLII